jgi:bacillithiol system protein YtxJ
MANVTELQTLQDFEQLLEASHERPVALLKHSIACPVSAQGQAAFVRVDGPEAPGLYAVVVQYAREVSNHIAAHTGVRHETPQVLVFAGGEVTYHASHFRITTDALREASREAAARLSA